MTKSNGVNWVESENGMKWTGYISGCGQYLYIGIVKEPGHGVDPGTGWIVSFGPRAAIMRFATLMVAQRSGVNLAIECLTEALTNLQHEKDYGPAG